MRRFRIVLTYMFVPLMLITVLLSIIGYFNGYTDAEILAMKICGYTAVVLLWINAAVAVVEYVRKKQKKDGQVLRKQPD